MITIPDILNLGNCRISFFDHYKQDQPEGQTIYWGELTEVTPVTEVCIKERLQDNDLYLSCNYLQYGDYDNSCMVERSNYKIFMEDYQELPYIFDMSGGYGSTGVAISIRGLLDPDNEETAQNIIDCLNALNEYPCIDDEDMSNMEYDAFLESLDSYCIRECSDLLSRQYLVEVYDFDQNKLKEVLLESDRNLDYSAYEIECGGSCYIDTKRLIEKVTLSQYFECLIDFELKGTI